MKRIHRALDKEEMVQVLVTGENRIFGEIWQLMLFAGAVGYRHQRREKLGERSSGRAVNPDLFDKSAAGPGFQYLLTLVTDNDASHLADNEENESVRVALFEEYINGGLAIMMEELEQSSYSLDAMIRFIEAEQPTRREGDLSDVRL